MLKCLRFENWNIGKQRSEIKMVAYNRVVIMGNLVKDPITKRFGRDNTPVAYLKIAINERRKTRTGELVETPVFVDVNAYDKIGELCERNCYKGMLMLVEGRLQTENRETPDGRTNRRTFIRAQNVKFLSGPRRPVAGKDGERDDWRSRNGASTEDSFRQDGTINDGEFGGDPSEEEVVNQNEW